ncbi:expressed unknown protein [Seminavis robusta]|uniref:ZZ-type domain-containing protein n=1 Tax=Seminavis robusta TaxID=568900 RepID=A0A9N8EC02_9STRA|nr:expressed unknown protein [Seminavis robusta]|eukprot:Sro869_g213430.1 n/a (845) ;mRNA; f:6913-9631
MTSFLESHKDFVLKLKFLGEQNEVAEIRRVRLPRIIKDATVSYEELVGIAISFVIPKNPSNASDFEVKLTYQDVDDDTVVIGSSEELMDAIEQFSEQRVLRVTAHVKRFAKAATTTTTTTAVDPPLSRAPSESTTRSEAAAQTGNDEEAPRPSTTTPPAQTPVLTKAVESVVNIILNAAVALNSRGGQEASSNPTVYYSPDGVPAPAAEEVPSEEPAPSPEPAASVVTESEKEEPAAKPKGADKEPTPAVKEVEPKKEAAKKEDKKPAAEERPFIHGRHTCDSCLTTPIVGKRYHAVDMSDYDLCAKCFSNYSGTEITFEAVELERDRHLQTRWNRRRDRMNNAKGRGGNNKRRFGPRFGPEGQHHKRWGPPAHHPPRGPPPPFMGPPGPSPPGPCPPPPRPPPHGTFPPPPGPPPPVPGCLMPPPPPPVPGFPPPPPPPPVAAMPPPPGPPLPWYSLAAPRNNEAKEGDLEKAIRLSLEEAQKKKAPPAPPAAPAVKEEPPKKKAPPAVVEDDINSEDKSSYVEEQVETASVKTNTTEKSAAKAPEPDIVVEPVLVETVKDVEEEEEIEIPATAPQPSAPMEEEVASVVSDPFEVHMPSGSSVISEIESDGSHHSSQAKEESSSEPSFSLDAAGNGDVADLLGSTLDACAQAIDAMVTELSRESSSDSSPSANSTYVAVQEDQEAAAAEGATILESIGSPRVEENDVQSESGRSEEDWQVVSEDQQVSGDEELARAAQMIGSALFNSDMRSSQELLSTLSGSASDAMSYASSVPTSVPSIAHSTVTTGQRERWASQLAKLRTMGIDDDAKCVEILERLTAANIGCGSDDEVSVEAVLDQLYKN